MVDTYKRAVFFGPHQIRLEELVNPKPGPRQALVNVRDCALSTREQRSNTRPEKPNPHPSEHQLACKLVELVPGKVTRARTGERVVA